MRIKWIDIAKGIAIIFVIIGHTIHGGYRGLIFSFHIPVFFIASAYTMKYSVSLTSFIERNKSKFLKWLLIAYSLFVFQKILFFVFNVDGINSAGSSHYFSNSLWAILWSSGVEVNCFGRSFEKIGMVWFLVVMAFARCAYDFLNLKIDNDIYRGGVCIGLTCISFLLPQLPFSFDIVISVLIFYFLGNYLKEKFFLKGRRHLFMYLFVFGFVWVSLFIIIYLFTGQYFEIAARKYPMGLVSFICASAGSLMVFTFSKLIEDTPIFSKIFIWLGKNSIIIFSVHYMDRLWKFAWDFENLYLSLVLRLTIDIFISALIVWLGGALKRYISDRMFGSGENCHLG